MLVYALLALALRDTHGHFRSGWVLDISVATAAWSLVYLRTKTESASRARPEVIFWSIAVIFMLLNVAHPRLTFWSKAGEWPLRALLTLPIVLVAALGATARLRHIGAVNYLLPALWISQAIVRLVVLSISPTPGIDVFVSNTHAADLFLTGHNPYQGTYADIYGGSFDYKPGFVYWPVVLILQSAARLIIGDIRMASVLADGVTGLCAWFMLRRIGHTSLAATARLLVWLTFPVHLFVLEQAWVDPILVAIVAITIVCLDSGRWLASAIAVGIGLATKQYFVVFAALWAFWLMRRLGPKAAVRLGLVSAAVLLLILLPFLIDDAAAFVRMTILVPLGQAFRPDSFSLLAYLYRDAAGPPGSWYVLPGLIAFGLWLVRLWRLSPAETTPTELARAGFFVLMWLFLFGKQAFCNYYTFAAFFLWLVIVRAKSERIRA